MNMKSLFNFFIISFLLFAANVMSEDRVGKMKGINDRAPFNDDGPSKPPAEPKEPKEPREPKGDGTEILVNPVGEAPANDPGPADPIPTPTPSSDDDSIVNPLGAAPHNDEGPSDPPDDPDDSDVDQILAPDGLDGLSDSMPPSTPTPRTIRN